MRSSPDRMAVLRLVAVYVVAAGAWILASDLLLFRSVDEGLVGSLLKGGAFVAVTAGLLAVLLARRERDLRRREREVEVFDRLGEDLVYHVRFEPEQHFVFVSQSATTLVGYTPEEHYADPQLGQRLVHPGDRHLLEDPASLEGPLLLRWRARDGRLIWTEQRNVPEQDGDRLVGLIGTARDVTARVLEERCRQLSTDLDRALLDGAPLRTALAVLADALAELLEAEGVELSVEDHTGCRWQATSRSAGEPTSTGQVLRAEQQRGSVRVELGPGSPAPQRVRSPLDGLAGQLVAAADHHARLVELRRLGQALEASGSAVLLAGRDGAIEWVNPAFTRITGYELDQVRGSTPRILKSGVQPAAFYDELWRTIADGRAFRGEVVNRRRDGTRYVASVTIDPVVEAEGTVSGFVGVQKDVTDEHTARRLLHERERRALERERDLERDRVMLVQVLSHELRTPLTIVLGAARTLQRKGLDAGVREELTSSMQAASDDLLERLDAIITITDEQELTCEPVDAGALLDTVVGELSRRFDASRVQRSGSARLCSDPVLLRALLRPLVENALKYSPPSSTVHVQVAAAPAVGSSSPPVVTMRIADRGAGIAPGVRDLLEQPLRQLDASTTRSHGGLGFGLAAARRAADRLGAELTIGSDEEQPGTVIDIRVPDRSVPDAGSG